MVAVLHATRPSVSRHCCLKQLLKQLVQDCPAGTKIRWTRSERSRKERHDDCSQPDWLLIALFRVGVDNSETIAAPR